MSSQPDSTSIPGPQPDADHPFQPPADSHPSNDGPAASPTLFHPTMRDVARYAGVSQATVSNVLNHPERVAAHRLETIQNAITELGFVRHEPARQLRSGRSKTLGLLLLDAWNPAFQDMARGVEEEAEAAGWNLLMVNSNRRLDREQAYLRVFAEARLPGMIVIPHDRPADTPHDVQMHGVTTVVVDRSSGWGDAPSVSVDDVAGGRLVAEHLTGLGHRKLVFVGDAGTAAPVRDRLAGLRETTARAKPSASLDEWPLPLTMEGGRLAAERFLEMPSAIRQTAIVAAVDAVAIGCRYTLSEHGVTVPDDVSVVGYDDISLAPLLPVPLTTVHRPHLEMGQCAARLLLQTLSRTPPDNTHVVFQPELIIRSSTKAVEAR